MHGGGVFDYCNWSTLEKALCYLGLVIDGDALVIWDVEHLWVEHVPVTMTQKDPIDFRVIGGSLTDQTLGHVRPIHAVLGNDCFRVKCR